MAGEVIVVPALYPKESNWQAESGHCIGRNLGRILYDAGRGRQEACDRFLPQAACCYLQPDRRCARAGWRRR